MDASIYLAFVLTSIAFIVVPGPNVLVIVATGIAQGRLRAVQTVVGTSSAMALQLGIVAAGTSWVVQRISTGFVILKWSGVAWLLLLGLHHFRRSLTIHEEAKEVGATGSVITGFVTSVTNPKTILFFSAFLPQFVVTSGDYSHQITLLSLTFLALATIIDSGYALASASAWRLLRDRRATTIHHRLSALLCFVAGIWLAMLRRVN